MLVSSRSLLLCLLGLSASPLAGRQVGFDVDLPWIYEASVSDGTLKQVIAADINRDGHQDLLVLQNHTQGLDYPFSRILLFTNQGDSPPTFSMEIIYFNAKQTQYPMHLADLDGDGDDDILYTVSDGIMGFERDFGWLENADGVGGTWTDRGVKSSDYEAPYSSAVGDLDGDGDLDIVASGKSVDDKSIWLANAGTGNFFQVRDLAYSGYLNSVAVGDVDLDGDLDIIASSESATLLIAFMNNGSGTFTPELISDEYSADDLLVGDFTGDRGIDVVARVDEVQTRCFTRGASSWSSAQLGQDFTRLKDSGDADRDGRPDIVAGNAMANTYLLYCLPTVNAWKSYGITGQPEALCFADMDGDGDNDLVTVTSSLYLRLMLNEDARRTMAFSPAAHPVATSAPGVRGLLAETFSRDRFPDVVGAFFGNDSVQSFLGIGYDDFGFETGRLALSGTAASGVYSIAAGDVDRDGSLDVVSAASDSGQLRFLRQLGLGEATPFLGYLVDTVDGLRHVAVGDLTGEGDPDIVVTSRACAGSPIPVCTTSISAYIQIGNPQLGTGWSEVSVDDTHSSIGKVAIGDLNNDGAADLVVGASRTPSSPIALTTVALYWYESDGENPPAYTRNTVASALAGGAASVILPEAFVLRDFDSDGDLDIVASHFLGNAVVWYENSAGDGSSWTRHDVADGFDTVKGVDAADADLDGDMDIAVASYATDVLSVLRNDGDSWQRQDIAHGEDGPWGVRLVDMNDDGFADLVAGFEQTNKINWYENKAYQCTLTPADVAPAQAFDGETVALARLTLRHDGGIDDPHAQIWSLSFSLRGPFGSLLTGEKAATMFSEVALYFDTDQNGNFSAGEYKIVGFSNFASRPSDTTFELIRKTTNTTQLTPPGEQRHYFVAARLKDNASIQADHPFTLVIPDTTDVLVRTNDPTTEMIHYGEAFESSPVSIVERTIESDYWIIF